MGSDVQEGYVDVGDNGACKGSGIAEDGHMENSSQDNDSVE